MKEEEIELGKSYICKPIGFGAEASGEVISKMTNCAVIRVNHCAKKDEPLLDEKANMVVAKYGTFRSGCLN